MLLEIILYFRRVSGCVTFTISDDIQCDISNYIVTERHDEQSCDSSLNFEKAIM